LKLYLYERIYLLLIRLKIRRVFNRSIIKEKHNISKEQKKEIYENTAYKVLEDKVYNDLPQNDFIINRIRQLLESEVNLCLKKIEKDF